MPRWLAWTLGALFALALVLHAHGPLWSAAAPGTGFSESDLRALASVRDLLDHGTLRTAPRAYFEIAGTPPLAAASLALSSALWSDGGAFGAASALPLRLENLLLFALAAAGAGVALRRFALPWLGDEHARAAAWVAAALCLVHPLAYSAFGRIAARGDLIALAACTWAIAEFLRGRQQKDPRCAIRAGALALCAGAASPLAWALPFVLALAELVSARRHRPWVARARTALVTLGGFAACTVALPALRAALFTPPAASGAQRSGLETAALALEKLGVLALPVDPAGISFAAYLLAAGVLVVAIEPAFSAARSAPRLWSLILALGALLVCVASCFGSSVRVQPGDFTRADTLVPGLFCVCAALALASTALGGLRRALVPAILATGWSAIAHEHAAAWRDSVASFDAARVDLARALALAPEPAAVLLLDVPELVRGVAPLERGLPLDVLAAPEFLARDAAELAAARSRDSKLCVAAPSRPAFVQFSRTARFATLRAAGIAVALDLAQPDVSRRAVLALPPSNPTTGSRRWFSEGASSPLDWEALSIQSVSIRGPRDTDLARVPVLGWQSSGDDGHFERGETKGVWIDDGDEPLACFDVAAAPEWLCAGRIHRALPVGGWASSQLSHADAEEQLPRFDPPPRLEDREGDVHVAALGSPLCDAAETTLARRGQDGLRRLLLLDLCTLEQLAFELVPDSTESVHGFVARGAGRVRADWRALGHSFAWCIECSADGVALVRDEGEEPAAR